MAWSFNPFTGNLDQTGSGAVVFEGEEETFDDLPVGIGDPPVGSSYLVRTSTGVWLVNRRQAGIWIRRNNTGVRATDWEYGGDYPVNSVNGQTGNVVLSSSNVGAIPTLTVTDVSVSGNATTNLTAARNALVRVTSSGALANTFILPVTGNQEGDLLTIFAVSIAGQSITIRNSAYTLIVTIGQSSRSRSFLYTGGAWTETTVNVHTHPATDITGTFSTLSANNGILLASAPVLDLSQTWNNAAATFTGLRFNVTNTASAAASSLIDLQVGGASLLSVDRSGFIVMTSTAGIRQSTTTNPVLLGGIASFNSAGLSVYGASVRTNRDSHFGWTPDTNHLTPADLQLHRDAADTLAQRRTTNPQAFRLYNTTDAGLTNYERGFMRWSSNVLQIGTEKAGTGSARALEFQTDGVTRLTIGSAGGVVLAAGSATVPSLSFSGSAVGVYQRSVGELTLTDGNEAQARYFANNILLNSDFAFGWGNSTVAPTGGDTLLRRDAAGTLAQYNGVNPQGYRLYNTFTSTNNFERLGIRWSSNECIIDTEIGGSGGTLRGIKIGSATSSLLGFYGVTPVDQPATVADPAGGGTVDTEARTAINAIIDRLQELGLIA